MKVKIRTLPPTEYVIGKVLPSSRIVIFGGVSIPFIFWIDNLNRIWIDDANNRWRL